MLRTILNIFTEWVSLSDLFLIITFFRLFCVNNVTTRTREDFIQTQTVVDEKGQKNFCMSWAVA